MGKSKYNIIMIKLRLKDLIEEHNISAEILAQSLELSGNSLIYEWIRQDIFPNYSSILKLVDYFHCSIEYLIGRTEEYGEAKFKQCPPFDEQLKMVMKQNNKTQYRMIKDGIANSAHFNKWFVKKAQPKLETLIKLADYFIISVDELVGRV